MIELDIVQYRGLGPIVQELGPLVEKCRVVFVGLDHKEVAIGKSRGNVEIAG